MTNLSEKTRKAIDDLSTVLRNQSADVIKNLITFELADTEEPSALCQQGLLFSGESQADRVIQARNRIGDYRSSIKDVAKEWLKEYEEWKDQMNHRQRRQILEDIIRILHPLIREELLDIEYMVLLARAYLYRSMLFRPKGYTTPARKIEGLIEARNFADKALKTDPGNIEALRIWAHSMLELEQEGEKSTEKEAENINSLPDSEIALLFELFELEYPMGYLFPEPNRLENAAGLEVESINDLMLLIWHAESGKNNTSKSLDRVLKEKRDWERPFDLCLFKASASFLKKHEADTLNYARKALKNAPEAFSDPFWDNFTFFLNKLRLAGRKIWKKLAVEAWEKCNQMEHTIANNVVLHWHWSRRKMLYDLTFLAETDLLKKIRIADSLKSKPTLRYGVLQTMKDRDEVRDILEIEDEARDGRYIKKPFTSKQIKRHKLSATTSYRPPKNWTAVHLYLISPELQDGNGVKPGYAIILSDKDAPVSHHMEKQRFDEMQQTFLQWQTVYTTGNDSKAAPIMRELCKKIGAAMPFLFEDIPKENSVMFIPHGFLHNIPLHAAICKDNDQYFIQNHAVRYLPAWHLTEYYKPSAHNSGGCYLLKQHFKEHKYDMLFQNIPHAFWENNDEVLNKETERELDFYLKKNPELLTILCHGKCDLLNPFRSHLLLEPQVSILDLLTSGIQLKGTRVLFGACETDMSPPREHPLDEHLSLSTVFLTLGAKDIVGGIYRILPSQIEGCYYNILFENDEESPLTLPEAMQKWQVENLKNNNSNFYWIVPFRIIGPPDLLDNSRKEPS